MEDDNEEECIYNKVNHDNIHGDDADADYDDKLSVHGLMPEFFPPDK
jgi:hypothetical protein